MNMRRWPFKKGQSLSHHGLGTGKPFRIGGCYNQAISVVSRDADRGRAFPDGYGNCRFSEKNSVFPEQDGLSASASNNVWHETSAKNT
jgi:hypothetical protein